MLGLSKKRYEYLVHVCQSPIIDENYVFDDVDEDTPDSLNNVGKIGWELIGVIPDMRNMSYIYYFQRAI